jgi:hypothetical protein
MSSHDIRDILSRLSAVEEGKLSPVSVKKGLTPQQDRVPQLPALFKPKEISVLGTDKDPEHPMKGYAVGASESKLAEAMAEIEEDMVSKVRKDLTHYLDQLEKKTHDDGQRDKDSTPDLDRLSKKEHQYRDMIEKAVRAIDAAEAVEEDDDGINAVNKAITIGNTIGNEFGRMIGQSPTVAPTISEDDYELTEPETDHAIQDKVDADLGQPQQPTKVMEVEPGCVFEVHQVGADHFEIRRGDRAINSRFKSADEADIALQLFQARRREQQKHSDADYIEER